MIEKEVNKMLENGNGTLTRDKLVELEEKI